MSATRIPYDIGWRAVVMISDDRVSVTESSPVVASRAGAEASNVRVAVFDRRPFIAEGLCALLERKAGLTIVGVGHSLHEAVRVVRATHVDVIVVGIGADDVDRADRLIAFLAARPSSFRPRVVGVISGTQTHADMLGGATVTVVTSSVTPDTLRDMVTNLASGYVTTLSPQLIRPPAAPLAGAIASRVDRLTERERDVLSGIEDGLSSLEIAALLGISVNTVRTHVQRLMSKLAVHSRVHAAAFAATETAAAHGARWSA